MPRSNAEISVDEYVARFTPEVQGLIRELRRVVKSVAPKAEEKADRGWPIRYSMEKGVGCAIGGLKDYANIYFGKGATMKDPQGLLEGTGKSVRHVKVRSVEAARSPELRKLVERAFR